MPLNEDAGGSKNLIIKVYFERVAECDKK